MICDQNLSCVSFIPSSHDVLIRRLFRLQTLTMVNKKVASFDWTVWYTFTILGAILFENVNNVRFLLFSCCFINIRK